MASMLSMMRVSLMSHLKVVHVDHPSGGSKVPAAKAQREHAASDKADLRMLQLYLRYCVK